MAPKRKVLNSFKNEKPVKKRLQIRDENSLSEVEEDDTKNKLQEGKNFNNALEDKKLYGSASKKENVSPHLIDENQKSEKGEFPILELNQLLQKKSRINFQGAISWKVFLFPPLTKLALISDKVHQYFGLDLVEDGSERTLWTHKASIWQQLFESVQDLAKTGQVASISTMFNGILACPVRAVPNGPNETQTFKSVKGQNIQHWIMLVPMPIDIDSSKYISQFIANFQGLCQKAFIRSAYKSGVISITQHPGLLGQISEDGNYWHVINNAGQKDFIKKFNTCLSEVLLEYTLKEVVALTFDVKKDPSTWTDTVKTYAYGN